MADRSLLTRAKSEFQDALKNGTMVDDFVEALLHGEDNVHSFYKRIGVSSQKLAEQIRAEYDNLPAELQRELADFNITWTRRVFSAVDKTTSIRVNTGIFEAEDVKAEAIRMFIKVNGVPPVGYTDFQVSAGKQKGRAAAVKKSEPIDFIPKRVARNNPREVRALARIGNGYLGKDIDGSLDEYLFTQFNKELGHKSIAKFVEVIDHVRNGRTFADTEGIHKIGGAAVWLKDNTGGSSKRLGLFRIDLNRLPGVATTAQEKDARVVFSPTSNVLYIAQALRRHQDYVTWVKEHADG